MEKSKKEFWKLGKDDFSEDKWKLKEIEWIPKQFEDEYYYTQCSIYTRVDGVSKIVERFQNYFARQMCKYLKKKKKF